jgi:hypothetical protein
MRLSFPIGARFFSTFVLGLLLQPVGFARERGPRVEVVCPSPPVPVKLANKQILVYELHVTNFDTAPLTLKRLEVFADAERSQPLSIISGDALSAIMIEAGSMSATKDSQTIGPAVMRPRLRSRNFRLASAKMPCPCSVPHSMAVFGSLGMDLRTIQITASVSSPSTAIFT